MSTSNLPTNQRIAAELIVATEKHKDWAAIKQAERVHVAVMAEPFLSLVFAGKKTVESRFSRHQVAPYQRVQAGDIVLMKAGPIVGCFTVKWVRYFDLHTDDIVLLREKYGKKIGGDAAFWQQATTKRYVSLMGIGEVRALTPHPITKTDRRGWASISKDRLRTGRDPGS